MTYLDVHTPIRRTLPAIIGGLALLLAGAMSVAGLNLFGARFGFGFVPLLVLAIWPRQANTLISLAFVFFAGLFTDWGAGETVGQSSLIFVLIWGFLRPELRSSPFSIAGLSIAWLATCGMALLVLCLSGMFVFGITPDFAVLGREMLLASCLLPISIFFRRIFSRWINDNEEWS